MHHLHVVTRAFRVRLEDLADWLYGCTHRRTTLPVTLPTGLRVDGRQSIQSETYIVCLECGRQFPYDWSTMRVGSERPASTLRRFGLGRTVNKKEVILGGLAPPEGW